MFNFRIIQLSDGNQIIDPSINTPYSALDYITFMEYVQVDNALFKEYLQRKKNAWRAANKTIITKIIDRLIR